MKNNTYSNDSLYPDKWDKPTITYIPTSAIDDNNINIINSTRDTKSIGGHDAVITNIIGNDKERFIPPLYPITQKTGYGVNSNYGYLNTTKNFLDGKNVLDDLYYPSQQYNLINDTKGKDTEGNDMGDNDMGGNDMGSNNTRDNDMGGNNTRDNDMGGNNTRDNNTRDNNTGGNDTRGKRYYNVVDSIKGNGRIISSNNDISPYINNINSNDISTCNGCSCCGGVVNDDNVNNRIKGGIENNGSNSKTQTFDPYYTHMASMHSNDYNKQKFKSWYPNVPMGSSNNDSKITQLEPRYTSVYTPTNGYTWASTPMPNTDNYYIDTIARNFSPILFSQNGKELGGYRYDEIKTGQRAKNREPFISQNSKNKYNSINKYIFIFVVIIIIFLIIKYNLI